VEGGVLSIITFPLGDFPSFPYPSHASVEYTYSPSGAKLPLRSLPSHVISFGYLYFSRVLSCWQKYRGEAVLTSTVPCMLAQPATKGNNTTASRKLNNVELRMQK
jgi:hypothetical protein